MFPMPTFVDKFRISAFFPFSLSSPCVQRTCAVRLHTLDRSCWLSLYFFEVLIREVVVLVKCVVVQASGEDCSLPGVIPIVCMRDCFEMAYPSLKAVEILCSDKRVRGGAANTICFWVFCCLCLPFEFCSRKERSLIFFSIFFYLNDFGFFLFQEPLGQ